MSQNIGFISTRFAGTDGVTLESSKWATVLEAGGHRCFWLAGELERDPSKSLLAPEMHFKHEDNQWISRRIFGCKGRSSDVTVAIHSLKRTLKKRIEEFVKRFDIDLIVANNCSPGFRRSRGAGA